MRLTKDAATEAGLAAKCGAVGLVGFVVDYVALKGGVGLHLSPAVARLISLSLAMQVTFAINRHLVFRYRGRDGLLRQWGGYMLTNGFGNVCNYWIFVTLSSLHGRWVSQTLVALLISAFCAYLINYAGVRLVVFGRGRLDQRRARGARREGQLGTT
jgi:putative flippase GtrA